MKNFQVYKASAGSGKTSRMVQEYLILALNSKNPFYFKSILGITFTNKAAHELKERIVDTLKAIDTIPEAEFETKYFIAPILLALQISPIELKNRAQATLAHLLHNYSELSISTIDSFMHRLVRAFTRDLKLPANFMVELDANALLDDAIEELISRIGSDPYITKVMEDFVLSRLNEERSFHVENDIKKMAYQLFSDDNFEFLNSLKTIENEQFIKARQYLIVQTQQYENELMTRSNQMSAIMDSFQLDQDDFPYKKSGIAGFFCKLDKRLEQNGFIEPGKRVYDALKSDSWTTKSTPLEKVIFIENARSQIQPILIQTLAYVEMKQSDYIIQKSILSQLHALSLLSVLQKIIEQIREESGKVHISEFNKRVLSIVSSEEVPFIYERLGEKYNHILIDEFQDTSVSQWRNLMPLIENALSKGYKNMIVGDGKQAIYRWRGGFAEQFTAMPALKPDVTEPLVIQRFSALQQAFEQQSLDVNRRSCKEIVNFNNLLFTNIKKHETYQPAIAEIFEGMEQIPDDNKSGGVVQLEFINFEGLKMSDFRLLVLEKTIERIRDLHDNYHYAYSDIAVLCRGNRDGSEIASTLLENEIPVISSEALLIHASPEVQFLLAWLKLLYDVDQQTAILVIVNYLTKRSLIKEQSFNTETLKTLKTGKGLINYLKREGYAISALELSKLSLLELCETLAYSFQISTKKNPFVRFFLEHIWQRTVKEGSDLFSFLQWWSDNQLKLSIITPSESDAVKVMTMHKSKGLQFPVVIVPFGLETDRPGDLKWIDAKKETNGILPVALTTLTTLMSHTRLKNDLETEKNRKIQDSANLLYVALTRPEEALYIITTEKYSRNIWENMLIQSIQNIERLPDQSVFQFGASHPKGRINATEKKGKEETWFSSLPTIHHKTWRGRINISKEAAKFSNHQQNEAQMSGNLFHQILEALENAGQLDDVLNDYIQKGIIQNHEAALIAVKLRKLMSHPDLFDLFENSLELKNEQSIIFPDGTVRRPDRIVKTDKGWFVVDFKTGIKKPQHKQQLQHYQQAIQELVQEPVTGILAYLYDLTETEYLKAAY